jgi:hypothetical protein
MRLLSGPIRLAAEMLARLVKATLLVALIAGIPYGLLTQVGPPLPRQWPTVDELPQALTAPVSDTLVLHLLAAALWLLWAAFVVCLIVEVTAAIRGVPAPRLRLMSPLQTFAGWLVAGVTASVLVAVPVVSVAGNATPAVATTGQPAIAAATTSADVPSMTTPGATTVADPATARRLPVYDVVRGDWMVNVAERFLGDEDRYVDIERLNRQWERRDARFPDHWEPGWKVVLPGDAHDRGPSPHATGQLVVPALPLPTPQPPDEQTAPSDPAPTTTPPSGPSAMPPTSPSPLPTGTASAPADPDGVVPEHTAPAAPPPSSTFPSVGTTDSPPSSHPPANAPATDDGQGVNVPGGWVTLPLAAALVAAAAIVWRRRRRDRVATPPPPLRAKPGPRRIHGQLRPTTPALGSHPAAPRRP